MVGHRAYIDKTFFKPSHV